MTDSPIPAPEPAAIHGEVERVIHASIASAARPGYADLERIRDSAVRHNEPGGVHAVLHLQSGWYVWWLEGPPAAVHEVVERVFRDPRHHSHRLVHRSRGPRYLLARWSMMMNTSADTSAEFAGRVEQLARLREQGRQYPPTSVMRRLAAPFRLPMPEGLDPESFHRVGICAADEGRAFEFVEWVAGHFQRPRESRRVAGEHDRDSGSDTVDFVSPGGPCRVIGVPRAALLNGLLWVFLPDWPHLLLIFGADARRNEWLADRVVEACRHLPRTPTLLGIARESAAHARAMTAARMAGLDYVALGDFGPDEPPAIWQAVAERLRQLGAPPSSQWDTTHPAWLA